MVNQIVAVIVVILSVSMLSEGNMDFRGLLSNKDILSNAPKAWHEYVKKLLSVSTKRNSLNEYNVQRFITEQINVCTKLSVVVKSRFRCFTG